MPHQMGDFQINERLMRYSTFIPRLYNLCRSYGFEKGKIMPSRAFCSDESQGFPTILITKHFGTFPFNHGRVGGIVATSRHSAHAHHGKDLAIIQASHVGYDPQTAGFGTYRRLQTDNQHRTAACGKISGVLDWYQREYNFARENVAFSRLDEEDVVIIDNQLLDLDRDAGLFLNIESLVIPEAGSMPKPFHVFSTSKAFRVNTHFKTGLPASIWQQGRRKAIGERLSADLFRFKRDIPKHPEGQDRLELNLSYNMPQIVTATFPQLVAAQTSTQIEFDRAYRTIINEPEYQGKNLAFVSGINIDISPQEGQLFPLTKFVPWAAFIQTRQGRQFFLEQDELFEALHSQSMENPGQIDLESAIRVMMETAPLKIEPDTGSSCRI
jgi:hypothetical protein